MGDLLVRQPQRKRAELDAVHEDHIAVGLALDVDPEPAAMLHRKSWMADLVLPMSVLERVGGNPVLVHPEVHVETDGPRRGPFGAPHEVYLEVVALTWY